MIEPSWKLEDAQQIADDFPYTFYKPSKEVVSQLSEGDVVKLIFSFDSDDSEAPSAERMWVIVKNINHDGSFKGILDSEPYHIKDLDCGDSVEFKVCHIIDTNLDDPVSALTEKYVKRCFVTNNILYDSEKVGYLYREEPDYEDDSGWRFTAGNETDEYMDNPENSSYVSLAAVLREDDSIVELLEREIGVVFVRSDEGDFIELEND